MSFFSGVSNFLGSSGGQALATLAGTGLEAYFGAQASDAARDANRDAQGFSQQQFDRLLALQRPFIEAGTGAVNKLSDVFVTGDQPFTKSPGFDFRMQEGVNALDRSAASRGRLFSGPQLRGLTEFGQNFATNEFNNEFNRLSGLAGTGQVATQNVGGAGNILSQVGGNQISNAGLNRATGFTNTSNALTGGIENLLSIFG